MRRPTPQARPLEAENLISRTAPSKIRESARLRKKARVPTSRRRSGPRPRCGAAFTYTPPPPERGQFAFLRRGRARSHAPGSGRLKRDSRIKAGRPGEGWLERGNTRREKRPPAHRSEHSCSGERLDGQHARRVDIPENRWRCELGAVATSPRRQGRSLRELPQFSPKSTTPPAPTHLKPLSRCPSPTVTPWSTSATELMAEYLIPAQSSPLSLSTRTRHRRRAFERKCSHAGEIARGAAHPRALVGPSARPKPRGARFLGVPVTWRASAHAAQGSREAPLSDSATSPFE